MRKNLEKCRNFNQQKISKESLFV